MDLNDLILDNSDNWSISGDILHYKKIIKIPVCYIDLNDVVWIFLDARIKKIVIRLVGKLLKEGKKFYFAYPDSSNPSGIFRYHEKVIHHYLYTWIRGEFNDGFNKFDFDYIGNLVEWVKEEGKFEELKKIYDELKKEVNRNWHDWQTKGRVYEYPEHIREEYLTIWRDIQISLIL